VNRDSAAPAIWHIENIGEELEELLRVLREPE
jgi:hypothetical protein